MYVFKPVASRSQGYESLRIEKFSLFVFPSAVLGGGPGARVRGARIHVRAEEEQ